MPKAMLVCALGAAAVWAVVASSGTGAGRSPAATAVRADAAVQLQDGQRMQAELEHMRATLARTEHRLAQLETNPSAAATAPEDDGALEPETSPKTAEVSDGERRAFVAQSYEREARDPSWQPEAELRSLLKEVLPAGAAIRALECKQTLCRLETTHPDQASQAAFVQAFLFARPGQERPYGGALFDEPAASPDGHGVLSTTYLLRPGHDMPAPSANGH